MELKKLEGKLAIRTEPLFLGIDDMTGEKNYDYSYTDCPIKILKVTDCHVIYSHEGTDEENLFGKKCRIMNKRWIDSNWIDYEELIGDLK